jgi:hypothetical protein
LSATRDHPLLRQVLRCGFVTHDQLFEFLRLECYERTRESFDWRVRRLVRHGLLLKRASSAVGGRAVYSVGASAALLLQGLGEYCLIGPHRLASGISEFSIVHALELSEIQLSLLRAGIGARWTPACEIRSQNVLTNFGYAKDYDAVVTVEVANVERRFALEYERSAKAKKRYAIIADRLSGEHRVRHLLYLASNHDVLSYLRSCFPPTPIKVWFGIVWDWHAQLLGMPVVEASSSVRQPLYEALALGRAEFEAS